MPQSIPVPSTGFQALILCGPGVSLNTFTANPEEHPKCLVPVANRPMVYYAIDFLRRSGISDITLITPPSSLAPLQAALKQNPHLTSFSSPSPSVLAPKALEMTMGTCELLRLPEVQACIKTDFLLLPCDLICEIPGESLLEAWMVSQSSLGGSLVPEGRNAHGPITRGSGGEQGGRRGGLGLYYQTKLREESVKGEATDFVAIAPLDKDEAPTVSHPAQGPAALRFHLSKVVMSSPMDTIKEKMETDKGFLIRHSLVEKHAEIKMLSGYRDAHLYVFPYWIKDLARNEKLESVSEDLIGYWAKSGWQKGLADKLGMTEIFERQQDSQIPGETGSHDNESVEEEIDLQAMSTTKSGSINAEAALPSYASRVKVSEAEASKDKKSSKVPPILAYVQRESAPFVRRVDSSALLLSTSLRLAKLPSIEEVGRIEASPFAHNQKIAHPEGIAQRCTVSKSDCLIAENVTVEQFAVIKESVIGSNCHISSGARLTRCVLMDGVTVGPKATLTNCIIGRRAKIGAESMLKECEVQDSYVVPEDTDSKNEKFMVFEGLDEEADMTDDNEDDMEL
ncbi:eukaryotic translation initiation factor subunit eIF2B-gamma [Penicillium maclennaniae]|uniref:eukaryotic translation initiation factor subunit eIF2B-gamma n=1 Tax=Penicillium maclennaniae TaxID=1343394 RepID=UPI002540D8C8|nr:eukaryotic translation initiation factor subunit eIF2B-gamma [Penicillium maclennaniae]KAJ5676520.1 eukaryotic translation initiation factor subunit eIF2B-gamma [Penicillium maclennaniae]